ncbi:MAG: phospholipid-binding protein MlaC [Alphaproteobacteria bacterium]
MKQIVRTMILIAAVLGIQQPATAQADVEGARQFVADLGQNAIQALTGPNLSMQQRESEFKALLSQNFDVERIGNFVLGQYRRQASEEELNNFYAVFEDTMVATYVGRFNELSSDGFSVDRAIPDGENGAIVTTSVRGTDGQTARVDWRLRSSASNFVVIDVAVEGVSIAQTLREEYASVLRQNGGTVGGLVDALRARLG